MMIRNSSVLEALKRVLADRGLSLVEWEASIGWAPGSVEAGLQPPEGSTAARNVRLLISHLGVEPQPFLELVQDIDRDAV